MIFIIKRHKKGKMQEKIEKMRVKHMTSPFLLLRHPLLPSEPMYLVKIKWNHRTNILMRVNYINNIKISIILSIYTFIK